MTNKTIAGLRRKLKMFSDSRRSYKALRRHLNKQPIGYPSTLTGVELRLLKDMFTVDEAQAGLHLTSKHETFDTICARAKVNSDGKASFHNLLDSMGKKGSIFVKYVDGEPRYALHPIAIGMFEFQAKRLSPNFFLDIHKYFYPWFGLEFFTTKPPQLRVIPVEKSLPPTQGGIATYDHIRKIIEETKEKIGIVSCICKNGKDMMGESCKVTNRRDVCMVLDDIADPYIRNGWARSITKAEAMEILNLNEKEGLVLTVSSLQKPQFVCSCCKCCCGVLEGYNLFPRPTDFAASNYYAALDPTLCNGRHLCTERCPMNAVSYDERTKKSIPAIDAKRCIGCGLCAASCSKKAITLNKKEEEFYPPKDLDHLYDTILQNKKSTMGKIAQMAKAVFGMKV